MEWLFLALALLLICGTGIFVAAEFSLLTLDRHTADQPSPTASWGRRRCGSR